MHELRGIINGYIGDKMVAKEATSCIMICDTVSEIIAD